MAEIDAKVNMSLDDIIKMDKKKKAANAKSKRGMSVRGRGSTRGNMRGNARGNTRGNSRGRGNMRGNQRGNMRGRSSSMSRRGQWQRYPQNNLRGGYIKKRYNNSNVKSNLTRSRSNMSLNRLNLNGSPRSSRGGYASRRGGRGLTRSRSRTNLSFNNKPSFMANKNKGYLKRTTSMPDLRDPSSVYNRLGYQNPAQIAYRSRVKRAKNVLLQRQTKAMRMQNALSLSPVSYKNMSPLKPTINSRQYNSSGFRSDQMMRMQRRSQYEQKLMRMSNTRSRSANPASMNFINSINAAYNSNRHPAMSLYDSGTDSPIVVPQRKLQRGRSPFRQSLQSLKAASKAASRSASYSRQPQRRSRSRSRSRPRNTRNSVISLTDAADLEDRSFSEVMYSLSNGFGVTGRTLNDRFSLF
ncbi:cyclin-dependent kinase 13-like isoform X2 [Nasonia vitripennis]|uniref:Uncharacterized protein n=1 Tax=Nasonia vitripennis TaxID=7425 RepID=A0A7M7LJP0_NASVI|nr:cyclin-dependent kinase 13-like isoform X2 [Nasonia vitripennis]